MALDAYNPSVFSCLTPPHKTGTEGLLFMCQGLASKFKNEKTSMPGFSNSKLMQIN